MRTNPKPLLRRSNFFVISLTFSIIFSIQTHAQNVPIGFTEGLMGNSGVAISDSTASSFYNPSLILNKGINSYSIGGNTLSRYSSETDAYKTISTQISPSYLSSLQVFNVFVHEFFLTNIGSLDANISAITAEGGQFRIQTRYSGNIAGYTFGFKGLPLGFQVAVRHSETQSNGFYEFQDSNSALISNFDGINRQIDLLLSMGGLHQFGDYRFGYKYVSRGYAILKKKDGITKNYLYIPLSNQYVKSESAFSIEQPVSGEAISIGHGFKINDHEFLTDSKFEEASDLSYTYNWNQTFGYKLSDVSGYQFMCGVSHLINEKIKYFGQNIYVSSGFSWMEKAHRSAVGMYYFVDKLKSETQVYGVTFSGEFIY